MSDIQARIRIGDGGVEGFNQFTLSPGYTTNEDTPYEMQQAPITNLTGQDQNATYHDSDDGPPEIINLEENNRVWRFTLKVDAGSKTGNLNALSTLKRHVSGKQSTAYQSYRNGSQEPVWFDIRLDSESLWTSFRIMRGVVDDGQSFYTTAADINDKALSCLVVLTCVPAGRGETIELRNDLPSSPHMIEDSDGDGLADGLVAVGTPTLSIQTTAALTGGVTQRFITDASSFEGVATEKLLAADGATAGTDVVAYVDFRVDSGDDLVSVTLVDGGGNSIDDVKLDPNDPTNTAAKVFVASDGLTVYRIVVSGTLVADDIELRITRASALATTITVCYIDKVYLQLGTLTPPDAFCSSSALKNRYDPTNTSAATRQQINYLDVWGVPGDMPALIDTNLHLNYVTLEKQVITTGKDSDDPTIPNRIITVEGEDFGLGPYGSTIADASRSGGGYERYTSSAPVAAGWDNTGTERLAGSVWRAFCIARTDVIATGVRLSHDTNGVSTETPYGYADAVNTWTKIDLGLLNLSGIVEKFNIPNIGELLTLSINAETLTVFEVDFFMFLRVDEFVINNAFSTTAGAHSVIISGDTMSAWDDFYYENTKLNGSMWYATPGITNRYTYLISDEDNAHTLTREFSASLNVTPMASHLLGTSDTLAPSQLPA